jgi:hypothetical protein
MNDLARFFTRRGFGDLDDALSSQRVGTVDTRGARVEAGVECGIARGAVGVSASRVSPRGRAERAG